VCQQALDWIISGVCCRFEFSFNQSTDFNQSTERSVVGTDFLHPFLHLHALIPEPEVEFHSFIHSFIHVTPVAEAHLRLNVSCCSCRIPAAVGVGALMHAGQLGGIHCMTASLQLAPTHNFFDQS
jgi:hypothetical protein